MAQVRMIESDKAYLSMKEGGGSIVSLQYPLTIQGEQSGHSSYLVFYAVEPNAKGLSNKSIEGRSQASVTGQFKEQTKAVIQLYMPNMVENVSHNYDSNDGGFVQDLMTNGLMSGATGIDKTVNSVGAMAKTVVDTVNVGLSSVAQRYNAQVTGRILGNRAAAMYSNSAPRQQTFMFQLRPRNLAELKEVGQILKTFLVNSSASLSSETVSFDSAFGTNIGGLANYAGEAHTVLEVPPLWFIEERINKKNANIRYTPKFTFGPAAISNIRINKTPDQTYEAFSRTAGDPIAIDLEITLTELRPQFSEYYEQVSRNLGKPDTGDFFFNSFK
ncbi:baseplate tail-tube junction protein [Vibrio vulnificus]|uniref:baseplate tail-tube junction protein n=1 Tax=Vibrio vulnificus TaxID=672 RepID=UPI0032ECADFA